MFTLQRSCSLTVENDCFDLAVQLFISKRLWDVFWGRERGNGDSHMKLTGVHVRKFEFYPLKETNLGVVQALFDPPKTYYFKVTPNLCGSPPEKNSHAHCLRKPEQPLDN